ncbi:uncharacterized protein LOC144424258 [Styela clava]
MGFRIQKLSQCPGFTAIIYPDTTNAPTTTQYPVHHTTDAATTVETLRNTAKSDPNTHTTPETTGIENANELITTSQRPEHANAAQGTVPNSTEMGNIGSTGHNGTSDTDGYEEVQAAPSSGYEEIRQATDGYEKVQIRAATQEQEAGYKATYANIA